MESIAELYPEAAYQRCVVHFYRNVWSFVPATKVRLVAQILKAIHACEDRPAAEEKTRQVVAKLGERKLSMAAEHVRQNAPETFSYFAFPAEHWRNLMTNNPMERVIREIRHRTRVIGALPDGNSDLILVCSRLRHIASKNWGGRRYMDMDRLRHQTAQTEPGVSNPAC